MARRVLGEQRWGLRHAEDGTLERAAAVALALREEPAAGAAPPPPSGPLTRRQGEVADLVAQG